MLFLLPIVASKKIILTVNLPLLICFLANSIDRILLKRGSTKTWNPESGNGNGNGIWNQISMIEKTDFCTIQREFVFSFLGSSFKSDILVIVS